MLVLSERNALLVTSDKQNPNGLWKSSVELFSWRDSQTYQHNRTLADLAGELCIMPGWNTRKSNGAIQVAVFHCELRQLRLLDLR